MEAATIDEPKLEAFMGQFVQDMGAAATAPLVVIGDKLGLYKAMADGGRSRRPSSPSGPAAASATCASGCASRPRAATSSTTGGRHVPAPPEQALALADEDSPAFIPGAFQLHRGDRQGRAAHHRALPHAARASAGTSTTTTCSRAPSGFSGRIPRQPGTRGSRRCTGSRRSSRPARSGRHRLRPRRVDDPAGAGVSQVDILRIRLP